MTPKQERFVAEYLIDLNATQAAIRAGYSAKTAVVQGSRLLTNANVAAAVAAARTKVAGKLEVTADRVIGGLLVEAEFRGEGASHGARVSAWGHLGKHLGMFVDRAELTVKGDLPDRLLKGRARAANT